MIRVAIKSSSRLAKAGLQSLLRSHPALRLVEDVPGDGGRSEFEPVPDVLLVEADTLADAGARAAMDWAGAGGTVVLLLRHRLAESVAEAVRAGVRAILPSRAEGPEIAAAIEVAAAGLIALHPDDIDTLLATPNLAAKKAPGALTEELTARELEVLRLVAAGLGNKEIASRLEISGHTVKFHVASIMGKLGAGSRTEAVSLGIRQGLIML